MNHTNAPAEFKYRHSFIVTLKNERLNFFLKRGIFYYIGYAEDDFDIKKCPSRQIMEEKNCFQVS